MFFSAIGKGLGMMGKAYAKKYGHTVLGRMLGGTAKATVPAVGGAIVAQKLMAPPSTGQRGMVLAGLKSPMPTLSGAALPSQYPRVGTLPAWRGPQGKLQFPWHDPRVPEFLKQFALDDAYLSVAYRAPKGYVVVRDPQGRPYALMKAMAKQFGLWKPAARPPISATDWKHYKRNQVIEKRLRRIASKALRKKGR
jgi:hypothetical protein